MPPVNCGNHALLSATSRYRQHLTSMTPSVIARSVHPTRAQVVLAPQVPPAMRSSSKSSGNSTR